MSSCSNSSRGDVEMTTGAVAECSILLFLLTLILAGNTIVYLNTKKAFNRENHNATCRLWRALAVVGATGGTINICGHVSTKLAGYWVLGHGFCQFYGLTVCAFVSWWIWLLVCIAMERFLKTFHPEDHPSLFSKTNLWIIVWGTGLVVSAVYLGPTYGWAEYSSFWGAVDMTVDINATVNAGWQPEVVPLLQNLLGSYTDPNRRARMVIKLQNYLSIYGPTISRKGTFNGTVLVIPLQFSTQCGLNHFLQDLVHGNITDVVSNILLWKTLANNSVPSNLTLSLSVSEAAVRSYEDIFLVYQGVSLCQLDYTHVNEHVTSFLAFHVITASVIPFGIIIYLACKYPLLTRMRTGPCRRRMSLLEQVECYTDLAGDKGDPLALTLIASFVALNSFLIVSIVCGAGVRVNKLWLQTCYMVHYALYTVPYFAFLWRTKAVLLNVRLPSVNRAIAAAADSAPRDCVKERPPVATRRRSTLNFGNKLMALYMTQKRYSYQKATCESIL